jgi:predicted Fe-S protein YdhL (DUF1289 family)
MTAIESPCVNICVLHPGGGACTGCGRTVAEIARWTVMSQDERRRVMSVLPDRLRALAERAPSGQ